ncbi:MAG: peptidoglycan D,D-transpeptidase FtsI family protein [Microbacteriaceae bacterium]
MIRELRRVSIGILILFGSLFASTTIIQVLEVDNLRVDPRNVRTLYNSYSTERGSIIVGNVAIAESIPVDDVYKYQRTYTGGGLYAGITGYFTINNGISGLELALNDQLSGQSNSQFFDQILALFTDKNPRGASVQLTVNPAIQQAARDALGDRTGAAIAIEPTTGRILALVTTPSFDPNDLATHNTDDALANFTKLEASSLEPLQNRAIAGALYHPGSVFKLVMAAAALDSGMFTTTSTFANPAQLQLPQSTSYIHNSTKQTCGGLKTPVTIGIALQYSCNIPFAEMGQQLGEDTIRSYSEAFGFGASIEIPLPSTPSIYPKNMDQAQLMLSSFGQFDVRVSPLQMAMVSSAIANGGKLMKPNLVDSILASNLSPLSAFQPTQYSQPISPETAAALVQMMVTDVSNGAASGAKIPGVQVAGKTGTAENGEGEPFTLWFTGFAPADNPKVVVAVVVENDDARGQTGTSNGLAAPMGRKIMEAVLAQ